MDLDELKADWGHLVLLAALDFSMERVYINS
jgi:hypothetical protein